MQNFILANTATVKPPTDRESDSLIVEAKVAPRHPSPFNLFMLDEIKSVKKMQPEVTHQMAFRIAQGRYFHLKANDMNSP